MPEKCSLALVGCDKVMKCKQNVRDKKGFWVEKKVVLC